jgi:ZIP family zinc transporter
MLSLWLQAGFWGLFSGSALLIGAAIGYFLWVPQRAVAAIMAFGAGVLISALSFELMDEAYNG